MASRALGSKLATALASLVLTLLALEIVLRLGGVRAEIHRMPADRLNLPQPLEQTESVPYGFVAHAVMRTTYASDPRGYFGPGNSVDHRFNSAGWRDEERSIEKPQDTFRILGLGDSYLFGQGVRHEDVCLTRLGELLRSRVGELRIETINAGLRSMNTSQERDLLLHRGLRYDPDLVILHFVLNDVEKSAEDLFLRRPKVEFTEDYIEIFNTPDALSRISRLWGWGRQRVLGKLRAEAYIQACLESFERDGGKWAQCRDALADIARICRERDLPLLVVIFPFFIDLDRDYPFQPIHDTVRGFCQSQGIPVLDLREAFRDFRGPELWVHPTDQHPNEIAHGIAAEAIAAYLGDHPELLRVRGPSDGGQGLESAESRVRTPGRIVGPGADGSAPLLTSAPGDETFVPGRSR